MDTTRNIALRTITRNAIEDIITLFKIMLLETNENMISVWEYQIELNKKIINSTRKERYDLTCSYLRELRRSINASVKYTMTRQDNEKMTTNMVINGRN